MSPMSPEFLGYCITVAAGVFVMTYAIKVVNENAEKSPNQSISKQLMFSASMFFGCFGAMTIVVTLVRLLLY